MIEEKIMRLSIVDSSAIVRAILEQHIKKYPDTEICASVANCKKALHFARTDKPDAVICGNDVNEAGEIDFINTISLELNIPVILLASAVPHALKHTNVCAISKPELKEYSQSFFDTLMEKINSLSDSPSYSHQSPEPGEFKILCLGASTGGPTAVSEVLKGLGNNFPLPILYTQHVEISADRNMAQWFSGVCPNIKIKLAENGEIAMPGTVYMAPADKHLVIDYVKNNGYPVLKLSDEEPERFLRPAVNKLFRSAAEKYRNKCLAILLTGMGADGANGCKEICDKGGWTIVEDKSTCVVFGMPAAAIEADGAKEILPRPDIPKRILELVKV